MNGSRAALSDAIRTRDQQRIGAITASLHGQEILDGDEAGIVSEADTDYDAAAADFGAVGQRVSRVEDVPAAVASALAHPGPCCVDLAVAGEIAHPVTEAMLGMVTGSGTVLPYYDNIAETDAP